MYDVDERDFVTPLEGVPQCDPGAPVPMVTAAEGTTIVAYYAPLAVNWETAARPEDIPEEEVALLRFGGVRALMFGAPNDEALHGHPLASRGLDAYGAYRVEQSSWVRQLERLNRVHPQHTPEAYKRLEHFVINVPRLHLRVRGQRAAERGGVARDHAPSGCRRRSSAERVRKNAQGCCFEAEGAAGRGSPRRARWTSHDSAASVGTDHCNL